MKKYIYTLLVFIATCVTLLTSVETSAKSKHPSRTPVHSHQQSTGNDTQVVASYIQHRYHKSSKYSKNLAHVIAKASTKFGVDQYLLAAIISKESSFNTRASHYGSEGLMQVRVKQHRKEIRAEHVTGGLNHSLTNVMVGSRILKECLSSTAHGNIHHALSLYNRGCSEPNRTGKIQKGAKYAKRILKEAQFIKNWTPSQASQHN